METLKEPLTFVHAAIAQHRSETALTAAAEAPGTSLVWSHDALGLQAAADSTGAGRLGAPGEDCDCLVPLAEVTATGHCRTWSGECFIDTGIGERRTYRGGGELSVSLPHVSATGES
jgi:hypothetical protein